MHTAKRGQASSEVFREFAWNIVGAISVGKGAAKSNSVAKRKPKTNSTPKRATAHKRGRK